MDVFLSYSSKESEEAYTINSVLLKNGISTWMAPNSIPPGSNYTREIPKAIKSCKVFLLILSNNAQESVWVSAEVENAFKNEKYILPFLIENCPLRDEFDFLLSRSQRIEAYEKKSEALNKLVNRIKALIESESSFSDSDQNGNTDSQELVSQMIKNALAKKETTPASVTPSVPFAQRFRSAEVAEKVRLVEEIEKQVASKIALINEKIEKIEKMKEQHEKDSLYFNFRCVSADAKPSDKKTFDNGDRFEGNHVNGLRSGIGRYTWASSNEYYGDFLEGKRTGFGQLKYSDGAVYKGDFTEGSLNGVGENIWKDGESYIGEYKKDKRTGLGCYKWNSGGVYYGDFLNNLRTGLGKHIWSSGATYEGDYVESEQNGLAKHTWESGSVYIGNYVKGERNGLGKYIWTDNSVFYGDFIDGVRTGLGKYIWPSGNYYEGEFEKGKLSGKGTYFSTSVIKTGTWSDDKLWNGTEYDPDGKVLAEYKHGRRTPK